MNFWDRKGDFGILDGFWGWVWEFWIGFGAGFGNSGLDLGWIWGSWGWILGGFWGIWGLTQLGVGEVHGPAHPEQRHLGAPLLPREVLRHLREIRDLGHKKFRNGAGKGEQQQQKSQKNPKQTQTH